MLVHCFSSPRLAPVCGKTFVSGISTERAWEEQQSREPGLNLIAYTNAIAQRAGVSIGALYDYFPNKEAILLAMARRELDVIRDRVVHALTGDVGGDGTDPVRRAIRALIRGYGMRSRARRILMETLFAQGGSAELARPIYEIAEVIAKNAGRILPERSDLPGPMTMFVLTRAVDGVIRAATYEEVSFLGSREFEDELAKLVLAFVSVQHDSLGARGLHSQKQG